MTMPSKQIDAKMTEPQSNTDKEELENVLL